jgi:hypothetical protein
MERQVEQSEGGIMSLQTRLDSLKERHAALDARIVEEDQRPRPDTDTLTRLKVEKLHVKEEIERLRGRDH